MPKYSVKNIQSFRSPDGGGYNCTLYCDGIKVGDCHDGGYGGGVTVHFNTREDRDKMEAHIKTLPKCKFPAYLGGEEYEVTEDLFISNMVSDFEIRKKLKKTL